jgi:hypothetical protein
MNFAQGWLTCLLLFAGADVWAALAVTGEVTINPPPASLLRGQTAELRLTVTNTGDEPLDRASSGTLFRSFGPTSTVFLTPTSATPPCLTQFLDLSPPPGQPAIVINSNTFMPTPIAPGESRECTLLLQVSPDAEAPFVQRFSISGSRNDQRVSVERFVTFTLGEQPTPISASSRWSLGLMGGLLLLLGVFRVSR